MKAMVRANAWNVPVSAESRDPRGRVLAIDYGRKKMGLALSDELGLTAQPLLILTRTNRQEDLRRLRGICRKHLVRRIVVGYPLHLKGEAGEMAAKTSQFASRLNRNLGIPVELVDERLTTWEAKQSVAQNGSRRGEPVDDVAAAIMLRDYLDQMRRKSASIVDSGNSGVC
jgi:putative Holliday junction resolvase